MPNGVFDLKTYKSRIGFPEDWITIQMAVDYSDEYNWEHVDVKFIMNFFKQVDHYEELIDFDLTHKATCLIGGNLDKKCVSYIGESGHNGKTTKQKLDKSVFGKYCGKLPLGNIVGRTVDAGGADPAMATSKGQRLKFADEANKNQTFNFSFIKTSTGNDEVWARPLYSNGFEFTPQFTLILLLNQFPKGETDPVVWERFLLMPHDTRFIADPPEDPEEQKRTRTYKADPFIETDLKKRGGAYFWILVEYLKKYMKTGLKIPESVRIKTEKYRYKNDFYEQFSNAKIEKTERELDYVSLTDLYIHFKRWYNEACPKSRIPHKSEFHDEMERVLGKTRDKENRWYKVKVKSDVKRFVRNEN